MRKSIALLIVLAALFAACETPNDTTLEKKDKTDKPQTGPEAPQPSAVSGAASNVNEISATLAGTVVIPEGTVGAEAGIYMSESASVYESSAKKFVAESIDANGNFTVVVDSLTPATTYYYKAYLKGDGVSVTGRVRNFKTSDLWVTVTVSDTSNFSLTGTATVTGNLRIQASQDYPIEANLYWGKDITAAGKLFTEGTQVPLTVDAEGNFTAQFGPFTYNATYSYVVRATVMGKTAVSAMKTFATPELPFEITVTTGDASMVRDTSALLRATYTVNYEPPFDLQFIFVYSEHEGTPYGWMEAGYITENSGWTGGYSWGGNSVMGFCRGLKPSTTYYFAAVAVKLNAEGTGPEQVWPGDVKSFTTTASATAGNP